MSETTDAVAGHAPNLFARSIVDGFPRFQVSCECGWKTAAEDSEQAATASHAEHARQPIGSPTWNPMRQAVDPQPSPTSPKHRVEVWDGGGSKVVDFEEQGRRDGSLKPKPTLADFLLARIAEEEMSATLAAGAAPAPWEAADRGWMASLYCEGSDERMIVLEQDAVPGRKTPGDVLHFVASHDPARVLAECAAKRQIVERAYELMPHAVVDDCWYTCPAATEDRDGGECCDDARRDAGCDCGSDMRVGLLLKLLAEPYAGHPDYRAEFRP